MSNVKLVSLTFLLCSCSSAPDKLKKNTEEIRTISNRAADSAKYQIDKDSLQKKMEQLDVIYAAIACPCPQWYVYDNNAPGNEKEYFYLEPASKQLINADTLFNGTDLPVRIMVTGQFYEKKGYPKNYSPAKGNPEPARVFRYTAIDIVERGQVIL